MKIGDKVLCMKNCKRGHLIKGQTYIINSQKIQQDEINSLNEIEIISIVKPNDSNLSWFRVETCKGCWNFDEYFISIKEQRKQKLKKLKCIK